MKIKPSDFRVRPGQDGKKTYLTLLVSTQSKDNEIWDKLRGFAGKIDYDAAK